MKKKLLTILPLIFPVFIFAQNIPQKYQVNWKKAGLYNEPSITHSVNIKNFGAEGNGNDDESLAFKNAVEALNGEPGIVFFPAGQYLFKSSLTVPANTILRGASSDSTFLEFNLNGTNGNCINVQASQTGSFYKINQETEENSYTIPVAESEEFTKGDFVEIKMNNGSWDTKPAGWATHCVGQISVVEKVESGKLKIKDPLRFGTVLSLEPAIRIIKPVTNVGLEYFTITRTDQPSGGPYNIYFYFANNCWIKGVESTKSAGSHVMIETSYAVSISGSYFHGAFEYDGASTHGYGITMIQHTSNCLVEDNVFKDLRHAMMVKQGANGNVFAYNYSHEPNRSEFPNNAGGDISCHGHYPFANLFEGNLVQTIHIDQAWGPNGPKNTFLRNRAELYGIIVSEGTVESDGQVFVGNEVTNTTFLKGFYTLNGEEHFEHGNFVKEKITPSNTGSLTILSLYSEGKPDFWSNNLKWPSIGLSADELVELPAYQRVIENRKVTVGPEMTAMNSNTSEFITKLNLKILTQKFKEELTFRIYSRGNEIIEANIMGLQGQIISRNQKELSKGFNTITLKKNLLTLPVGWYMLNIQTAEGSFGYRVFKMP